MTREITHMKAFTAALESMNKPRFMIGRIPPTAGLVDQFFNDSTGAGTDGEIDARGPWNEGGDWQRVEAPAFQDVRAMASQAQESAQIDDHSTSTADNADAIEQLLVDSLSDLLHAEGQLTKAIPKMIDAANADSLRNAFEHHLEETQEQVDRLKEVFTLIGVDAAAQPCRGMEGLLEEGQEVIDAGEEQDPATADLALIAAAQKVEHYEISAYGTARTLAAQAGLPAAAELLGKSLAEEEIADNLLTQIARELMSEARTGLTKSPKRGKSLRETKER
jgi:Mn-containing catalase